MNKKVLKIALVSRLISLVAQSAFNNLVQDYDSSAEHCSPTENITGWTLSMSNTARDQNSLPDQVVLFLLGGNAKWDAVYFLDIATNGYQYEQNMAFFPLMPLLVNSLGLILSPVQLLLNLHDRILLILAATIINMTAFIFAALGLFHLTQTIFHSRKIAYKATLFFCFNPASVFFSAAYSESIYAMTQFWGMFYLEKDTPRRFLVTALLFSLGTGVRSNGVVSTGFIIYKLLRVALYTRYKPVKVQRHLVTTLILNAIHMVSLGSIVIFPFIAYQYYGFRLFCHSVQKPPWCKQIVPLPYSYIQKHYWDVGFLRYFQLKQLPNFLLATPAVVMCVLGIFEYVAQQTLVDMLSLGLRMSLGHPGDRFVYVVHLGFLLVFGVTSMHVQVLTRFIASSSPMLYWFAATWTTPRQLANNKTMMHRNIKSNLVFTYFLLYYWLGFLLHCNFYPWT